MEMTLDVHQCCSKQNLAWEVNLCIQVLFHTSPSSEAVSLGRQWWWCEEKGRLQESSLKVASARASTLFVTGWSCGWEQGTVFFLSFLCLKTT